MHEFKWQFESLTLKLNSFLVHWWKLSIVIGNGSWEWCSICCDTKLFIFVNITWINIIEIFYKRRLHGLCRRLVAHNNPSFSWWKFKKKQNTCVILGNCMCFFFGICLIFWVISEFVTHILFTKTFAAITMIDKMTKPGIGPDCV